MQVGIQGNSMLLGSILMPIERSNSNQDSLSCSNILILKIMNPLFLGIPPYLYQCKWWGCNNGGPLYQVFHPLLRIIVGICVQLTVQAGHFNNQCVGPCCPLLTSALLLFPVISVIPQGKCSVRSVSASIVIPQPYTSGKFSANHFR